MKPLDMRLFFGLRNDGMRVKDDTGVCIPETGKMCLSKQCSKERERRFSDGLWTYQKGFMQFEWDRVIPGRKGSD